MATTPTPKNTTKAFTDNTLASDDQNAAPLQEKVKPYSLKLPSGLDINHITTFVTRLLMEQMDQWVEHFHNGNYHLIQYGPKSVLRKKLGLQPTCHLYLYNYNHQLQMFFQISERVKQYPNPIPKAVNAIKSVLAETHERKLTTAIANLILTHAAPHPLNLAMTLLQPCDRLMDAVDAHAACWIAGALAANESPIAWLQVGEIKKTPFPINAKTKVWFLLTTHQSKLVGFDESQQLVLAADVPSAELEHKSELGRDRITGGGFEWLTQRSNCSAFQRAIQIASGQDPLDRLSSLVQHYWPEGGDKGAAIVQTILDSGALEKHPYYPLQCMLIVLQHEQKDKSVLSLQIDWADCCRRLLAQDYPCERLTLWFESQATPIEDQISLTQFLVHFAMENQPGVNLLPFHRDLRNRFHKQEKDPVKRAVFDLEFCQHLIHHRFSQEAASLLETSLEKLPDESMSDLLPPEDMNLAGENSGQVLRLAHYELLVEARGKETEPLLKCAMLQPLVADRVKALAEVAEGNIAARAEAVRRLLTRDGMKVADTVSHPPPEPLPPESLTDVVPHPAARDHGLFDKLQTWLGEVTTPDYSSIRAYAEPVTPHAHPQIATVLQDTSRALHLPCIPAYVAHGEKGFGLQAFESDPSFLMVGSIHLDPKREAFLREQEWRFAIGVELAHLHYKHTRLTADEVWRGAADKGFLVLDTLLAVLPMGQFLGKTLSGVSKLNSLAGVLQAGDKVMGVASKGRDMFDKVNLVSTFYKEKVEKFSSGAAKERELLATARIMQLTADRAGLLCCRNLRAAVRAIFLTDPKLASELPQAERHGLTEVLLIKEPNGNYRYQELAIRLAALIAFYLSPEYQALVVPQPN